MATVSDNGWLEKLILDNQERTEKRLDILAQDVLNLRVEVTRLSTAHAIKSTIVAASVSLVASATFAALAQRLIH